MNLFKIKRPVLRWKLAVFAALAVTVLAIDPQVDLWRMRGHEWNGAYAYTDTDEVAYAAYFKALSMSRPRRNDPYTGRDDQPGAPQPESLFSIQFLPAYIIALPARVLGLSTSTTFILLMPIAAIAATFALFWLFEILIEDDRKSAVGALAVLCLGTLVAGHGAGRMVFGGGAAYIYLPFLRRYLPAVSFPFYFIYCALIWRMMTQDDRRAAIKNAVVAGLFFATLVYSYFYFWTAAIAWTALLVAFWIVAHPSKWKSLTAPLGILSALAAAALAPYFLLLSRRAVTMDTVQALSLSHAPDLMRLPTLVGIATFVALSTAVWHGRVKWREPRALFAASFTLLPVVVFNQQIITGRSLQPIHYEQFIANYVVLVGVVLTAALLFNSREQGSRRASNIILTFIATVCFGWGLFETVASVKVFRDFNVLRDQAMPVMKRLAELSREQAAQPEGERGVVLSTDLKQVEDSPSVAPQAVLWARHMHVFSGVTLEENKQRFFEYLYYTDVDEEDFNAALEERDFEYFLAVFGWERTNPNLAVNLRPITDEEIRTEERNYANFIETFDRERASSPLLSFIITPTDDEPDFDNLDEWYERDAGEHIGNFTLYRVHLRPEEEEREEEDDDEPAAQPPGQIH
ncbi:MAG: hypothetical protein AUG51_03660 [Acidobacteria bacterium 13_1_20CM_3_53_8]|nr:MAG: hypothetical protein AUG51_03660 [Acidobacteria bacterium 13_1_20CM_3_53_8]